MPSVDGENDAGGIERGTRAIGCFPGRCGPKSRTSSAISDCACPYARGDQSLEAMLTPEPSSFSPTCIVIHIGRTPELQPLSVREVSRSKLRSVASSLAMALPVSASIRR